MAKAKSQKQSGARKPARGPSARVAPKSAKASRPAVSARKSTGTKSTASKSTASKPARRKPSSKKASGSRASLGTRIKEAVGILPANDLVSVILEDHKRLKELIAQMKNSDLELKEREIAFDEFAPALLAHARPEEQTLYTSMKSDEDLREDGFEGDVEHGLADQMIEEIKRTEDEDLRSARLKVLAELVAHHIQEEEEDMLPEYRKSVDVETRVKLGEKFLSLKAEIEADGADDAPPEELLLASSAE